MLGLTSLTLEGGSHDMGSKAADQLALLQSLPFLCHLSLSSFDEPVSGFEGLTALRELFLSSCGNSDFDFGCCTQIAQLSLTWSDTLPEAVVLPAGNSVNLQRLSLSSESEKDCYSYRLENLQAATQLILVDLFQNYPQ